MTGSEFHDVREQQVAEDELRAQRGEVLAELAVASFAASQALSKATLLYGPGSCGPVVNAGLADLEREIATAIAALRSARRAADALERQRVAAPARAGR